jgi:acetylornithine deacetylase
MKMTTTNSEMKVLHKIDQKSLVELLRKLVSIRSINPPGQEGELAYFIYEWAKMQGFEATLDEVCDNRLNVYITLPGEKGHPKLLFNGHLDVVPEGSGWSVSPFDGVIKDDLFFGRGASDMKGGIAAMLMAAKAIKESEIKLDGDLLITLVIDEEVSGKGTRQVLSKGITADYAIVGEPTSLEVVIASKGDVNFEIEVLGKAAHSSRPHEGKNAIYKMCKIIEAIEKYSTELEKKTHPLLSHPTITVTMINGGITPWIIPANCKVVIDRRTIPGENADGVKKELETILLRIKENDPELIYNLRLIQEAAPAEISPKEEIVDVILNKASIILGKQVKITGMSGTTDARFLINDAHIPTVIYGPGDLMNAHQPDEYVKVSEVSAAAKIYASVALHLLKKS